MYDNYFIVKSPCLVFKVHRVLLTDFLLIDLTENIEYDIRKLILSIDITGL